MARLIDLEVEGQIDATVAIAQESLPKENEPDNRSTRGDALVTDRTYANVGLLSGALICYPIASQLAEYLDLNSLHELSRTCRVIRAILLQYRTHLIKRTLRCVFENLDPTRRLGNALHASPEFWTTFGPNGTKIGRITSGKIGACARDMVGGCRRCGQQVCRNCVAKVPSISLFNGRHRRLCRTCMKAPLHFLTTMAPPEVVGLLPSSDQTAAETRIMARSPCSCEESVWICHPCGQTLRTTDTTYARGWAWRTRYSASGGLGAGLGEGNEGVECGRSGDAACLAAREVEHEIEYDTEELASRQYEIVSQDAASAHNWSGNSYTMHEIVGIGGRVKTKLRKTVLVGAMVKEYEDERTTGTFLAREHSGTNRSWCSWCSRVIPSIKDRGQVNMGIFGMV